MTNLKQTLLLGAAFLAIQSTATADTAFAVTVDNDLVSFDTTTPGTFQTSTAITGLRQSDGVTADPFGSIFELTYDNANGTYYGLDGNANLYSINVTTGAATYISNSLTPVGFSGGLAYDPFGSDLRFVSDASENISLSLTGTVTTGNDTFYGALDPNQATAPQFFGLGIDRDFGTGYTLDANLDVLAFTVDPNFEEFFTIGSLGIDVTSFGALEILDDGTILASLSLDGISSSLYTINSSTGVATEVGDFATGVSTIAVPEPSTWAMLVGGSLLFIGAIRRRLRAA